LTFDTNVGGTFNVFKAAKATHGAKVLVIITSVISRFYLLFSWLDIA